MLKKHAPGLAALSLLPLVLACTGPEAPDPLRGRRGEPSHTMAAATDSGQPPPADIMLEDALTADGGDAVPTVPNATWDARARQLEDEQARRFRPEAFTTESPASFSGSVESHVPHGNVVVEGGRQHVVVVVDHLMGSSAVDAGTDADADAAHDAAASTSGVHYVTTVYLRGAVDGVGMVVGLWEFSSDSPAPPTVRFTLPEGLTNVTAYSWCTLQGLWASDPIAL